MATTTTNISLTKPEATDTTLVRSDFNDNMDLIDAALEDILAYDTTPILRGNLDIGAFNIEGVDATEFGYLNGISSFGGTLIDDANSSAARTTLGLVIGTNVQAADAGLLSIAGLTTAANKMIYTTASNVYAVIDLTAFARSILDDADEATFKATVNLEIGTDVQACDASLTSIAGLTYASDSFIKVTAEDVYAIRTLSEVRTDLGLVIGTNVQAADDSLTSIAGLTYASDSFIKVTAEDVYAIRTITETKTDLSLNNVSNVATDDTAYNATSWDANTDAATKNALRDKFESLSGGYTNLTSFVDQTAWRVFYSNTAGDVTELALGADGTYLKSNGAAVAPTFVVPAGAGDVSKVGTPADSQVGVWTGDGTIEGAASFTYDGSNLQITGDIGATGSRITKGWFANLETTGDLTVNGTALASIYATLGANTNISSILNVGLYVGRDADNQIKFATDNNIVFRLSGADGALFNANGELDMNANTIGFTQQTVTYNVTTTTVDWTNGNKATMTFGAGNIGTFAFTNPTNPCNVVLKVIQDGTGSRVVTAWDADIKWAGGSAPTLTTGANTIDVVSFYWDGTNYFGVASLAFS